MVSCFPSRRACSGIFSDTASWPISSKSRRSGPEYSQSHHLEVKERHPSGMSQEGAEDCKTAGGITLFARPGKKRKSKALRAADAITSDAPSSAPGSTAATSTHEAQGGATPAGASDAAAERQLPAETSGRAEADEEEPGFRALGVSEWLDRCALR